MISGENVFVSGADGFIGSHLCELLVSQGFHVKAGVYYNSWGSVGWLQDLDERVRNKIEIVRFDIRDPSVLVGLLDDVSIFFNLASLISIPFSYQAPKTYFDTNTFGVLNILELMRINSLNCRLVQMSTSEVYGSAQYVPIDEGHPLVAQSPYAASKIAADKAVESYARSFGIDCVIGRAFNTYGPRQTARAVIPSVISQMLTSESVEIGSLAPKRDFCFVADTVDGLLRVANSSMKAGEVINIGTGASYSIEEVVQLCSKITGFNGAILSNDERIRPDASEVNHLLCNASRLVSVTGWKPKTDLEYGLSRTADWIKANLNYFKSSKKYN
ncbi:GDP-mannose 4,6-dehydratase [Litoricolaceae bacterium]|nr:GDP-mannose 4,6-dehydratase [Litorivicinaceae bacterium]